MVNTGSNGYENHVTRVFWGGGLNRFLRPLVDIFPNSVTS